MITGTGTYLGNPISTTRQLPNDSCNDVIQDYGKDHGLSITRRNGSGCILNYSGPNPNWTFQNWPCALNAGNAIGGQPDYASYANRILSQTGPLTPSLYLPVFIYELKDIPSMLKHAGDLLHKIVARPPNLKPVKEAAAATLAYQFGWKPLMDDMLKLSHFADIVKKRQRVLKRAHTKRGVRRIVTLDTVKTTATSTETIMSTFGVNITARRIEQSTVKRWATLRWTVRDQSQIGYEPSFTDAFRTAAGLNAGHIPIEIWKALPWSWAIDWFADISNLLAANYNMIYYKPSNVCYMIQQDRYYTIVPQGSWAPYVSLGVAEFHSRFRSVNSPNTNISLRLPFLDNFKLSIVGSMTILGLTGRR